MNHNHGNKQTTSVCITVISFKVKKKTNNVKPEKKTHNIVKGTIIKLWLHRRIQMMMMVTEMCQENSEIPRILKIFSKSK